LFVIGLLETAVNSDVFASVFKVFFSELKYTYVESEPAYPVLALLCDIGGALGLILGSTMLTFCELADFMFMLATTWIKVRASAVFTGRRV